MIGHTKLPWHAEDDRVVFGAGLIVAECYGGTTKESIANAAFIVKAVNNHEALVKALEFIRDGYDNQDISHVDYRVKVYQVALDVLSRVGTSQVSGGENG